MRDPMRAALRHLCDGVTAGHSEALLVFLRASVLSKLHLMSSVTGWFDGHDGRRRTYPRSFGVPIVCNFRIMDHLLHALPGWIASCFAIAGQLSSLIRVAKMARAGEDDPGLVKRAFAVTEALMLSLLTLDLLGRPTVSPSLPFASRVHCHPLKFMLSDIFLLVGCAACSHAGRPADGGGDGRIMGLNECINEYFGSSFCLHRAAFGPSRRRDRVPPDALADYEWRSRCRVLAEATMAVEAALMNNMFGWLSRHGLFSECESHAPRARRRILLAMDWSIVGDRAGALQAMTAIAQDRDTMCAICWSDFDEAPCEALMCGHVFHAECLARDMEARGVSKRLQRCPKCKMTADAAEKAPVAGGHGVFAIPDAQGGTRVLRRRAQARASGICGAGSSSGDAAGAATDGQNGSALPAAEAAPAAAAVPQDIVPAEAAPADAAAVPRDIVPAAGAPMDIVPAASQGGELAGSQAGDGELAGSQAGDGPVMLDPLRGLQWRSAAAKRRKIMKDAPELVQQWNERIRAAAGAGALNDVLFSKETSAGFENAETAVATIKKCLESIANDTREPHELAADLDFDQRPGHPLVWYDVVKRICDAQGYHHEGFALLLESNIGFCEHSETYLTHDLGCTHRVSPSQACLVSQSASMRKSPQLELADSLILDAESAPLEWADRKVLMTDGTKKGTESTLEQYRRGLLSSSEGANTIYVEGYSSKEARIHFFFKQRLCQWTQAESISSPTGHGPMALVKGTYNFGCRIITQPETADSTMRPGAQGWHKRLSIAAAPQESRLAGWANGFADTECQDFLKENRINKWWKAKLLFFRSDLLRSSLSTMRIFQHCAGEQAPLRSQISFLELAAALQRVRRQWQLHHGAYISMLAKDPSVGGMAPAPLAGRLQLSLEQTLQAALLQHTPRDGRITYTAFRLAVRGKRGPAFRGATGQPGVGPLMPRIKVAVAALVAGGVLEEAPGADQGFVKVGYLKQSEKQAAFRRSLGVSVEAIHAPARFCCVCGAPSLDHGPIGGPAREPSRSAEGGPRAPAHPRKAWAPRAALPELGARDAAALDAALAQRDSARSGVGARADKRARLALRFRAGRTRGTLARLLQCGLVSGDGGPAETLAPRAGLAGKLRGEEVVVLDAFVCRGRLRCDVAPVVQGSGAGAAGGAHVLRTSLRRGLTTRAGSDLTDVQHRWRCRSIVRGVPWMARVPEGVSDGGRAASVAPRALVEDAQMLQSFRHALAGMNVAAPACQRPAAPVLVIPKAADDHARQFRHWVARQQGGAALQPSGECRRGSYVWDFPWPVQLASCGGRGDDVGHRCYFPVADEDVVRVVPDAIVIRGNAAEGGQKEGRCYVTGRFLARFLFCLNDTLNFRECRRQLLGEYVAVARGAEAGLSDAGARAVLFNIAFALPKRKMLGMIAPRAFSAPISRRVSEMRRLQSLYNGSGLRVDGNFKLAKKIWRGAGKSRQKPFSCVLGICGTDGSPLLPVAPARGEAWMDIKRVLQPLLADIVSARQAAGMSLEDACPAFVSTDSYNKHFKKYADVVNEACQLARVRTAGATPRGPLAARCIVAPSVGVLVAGEPFHDVLNARNRKARLPCRRLESAGATSCGLLWLSLPRPSRKRSRRCVFNSKLRRHYSRLLKSRRLSGLLAWQECAEGLRAAGVGPRSGTVPVEQSWAITASHWPSETKTAGEKVFKFFADLSFLRFLYMHFHSSALPAWVDDGVMYFQQSERARLMLEPETKLRLEQELADAARQSSQ
ncbi:unnamed protein product [Prorocentrum cordatum]|uniref:RING-type domain-containing protein n=1 Tax=Prorocentrum cordatum TaxID=2364126 RepID=A0ABN9RLB2_9DINO|nr:unnamed protein product [Polarella glacialis]